MHKTERKKIEKLLGEMVALTNRSNLPKGILPVLEKYQTKDIQEEVAKELFKLNEDIKWCGYRYDTLHVYIKENSNTIEKDGVEKAIHEFLASQHIDKIKLFYINGKLEEYSYVGSKIHNNDEKEHYATLGCFAEYKNGFKPLICGLISKHFAKNGNEIFDKDKMPLGTIIPETLEGFYDISAAEIRRERVTNIDTSFKNYYGAIQPANIIQSVDNLQNQPVYLRGASTALGVGTIEIPKYLHRDGKSFMKVSPGSITLGKPDSILAEPGDSGAILCLDDHCQNIGLCSMLMGQTEDGCFCFLPLSSGIEQLNETTNGEFVLKKELSSACVQIQSKQSTSISTEVTNT